MKKLNSHIYASLFLSCAMPQISIASDESFVTIDCKVESCIAKLWKRGWLSNSVQQEASLQRQTDGSFLTTRKDGVTLAFFPNRNPMWFLIRGRDGKLRMPFACGPSKDDVDYVCLMTEYAD